jgi:hypothetical protein
LKDVARLIVMHYFIIGALLTSLLLVACQNTAPNQTADIPDNLVRVDHTSAKLAYVDPNAEFSKYTAILLTPLGVDNVEIIQPSASVTTTGNPNWQLTDADKQRLQQDFREAMVKQLSKNGGYPLVDTAADNVLRISAILTRIAPTAPKDDNRSRPPGRGKIFTEGAGKLRVEVTFSDAETGAPGVHRLGHADTGATGSDTPEGVDKICNCGDSCIPRRWVLR